MSEAQDISGNRVLNMVYEELQENDYDVSKTEEGVQSSEYPRATVTEIGDQIESYLTSKFDLSCEEEILMPSESEVEELADGPVEVEKEGDRYTFRSTIGDREDFEAYLEAFERAERKLGVIAENLEESLDYFVEDNYPK